MGKLLFGILVYPVWRRNKYFGEQYSYFLGMHRHAASENTQIILFQPIDIDWSRRRIHAYRYADNGVVSRVWTRFPDVIYDRFFPRHYARHDYAETVNRLIKHGIPFINGYLGGKLNVAETLAKDPVTNQLLPETHALARLEQVDGMLAKYGRTFVKPVNGTQGAGIVRIDKNGDRYTYVGKFDLQKVSPHTVDHATLHRFLAKLLTTRPYLVQQPIALRTKDNCVMDVRCVAQKGEGPGWFITGMAWRVGEPGSVTSNLHTGGHAEVVEEPMRSRVTEAALSVVKVLDERIGPFGELGLDFGVDTSDRIWFIEANGRLGRMIFTQLGAREENRISHLRPLQYARWLHQQRLNGGVGRNWENRPIGYRA